MYQRVCFCAPLFLCREMGILSSCYFSGETHLSGNIFNLVCFRLMLALRSWYLAANWCGPNNEPPRISVKITALEEYGLRCLLHVAKRPTEEPISAQTIADLAGLSLPYTQKILRTLAQGKLIEARRGVRGGYVLARPVERIAVGDAVRVLGGMFDVDEICDRYTGELESCSHNCSCTIRPVWSHIAEFVVRTLDSVSIAVLMQDQEAVADYLERIAPMPAEMFCPVGVEATN